MAGEGKTIAAWAICPGCGHANDVPPGLPKVELQALECVQCGAPILTAAALRALAERGGE